MEDSSSLTGQDTDRLPPDSSAPEDSGPDVIWDRDQDGYPEDEDCNDYDDSVYPGASEEWNAVDDDCNGRIDADGNYLGDVDLVGQVIIEGVAYGFDLVCPASLVRDSAAFELMVECRPQDSATVGYLGEEMDLAASDSGISGAAWSGRSELSSSQGWSTQIVDISLLWSEFSQVAVEANMSSSTASLSLDFSGQLLVKENP